MKSSLDVTRGWIEIDERCGEFGKWIEDEFFKTRTELGYTSYKGWAEFFIVGEIVLFDTHTLGSPQNYYYYVYYNKETKDVKKVRSNIKTDREFKEFVKKLKQERRWLSNLSKEKVLSYLRETNIEYSRIMDLIEDSEKALLSL